MMTWSATMMLSASCPDFRLFNPRNQLDSPSFSASSSSSIDFYGAVASATRPAFHHNRRRHSIGLVKNHNGVSRCVYVRARSDGAFPFDVDFDDSPAADLEPTETSSTDTSSMDTSSTPADGYISLFVRMLGLDNDPRDREQAVVTIWRYALGGKEKIDNIMQFNGCLTLIINLLNSESSSAREAAAGLLRLISSVDIYRNAVADSGAIEELTALLARSSLTTEAKQQSLCTLWNLSVDENFRVMMAQSDLLPLLIKFLDDVEDILVIEAAGGVLANLALTHSNHALLVEAGVIPKLARFLTPGVEGSKTIRREAKTALSKLSKDDYYRILIMEEDLLVVPLVGAAAFESFKPSLHSWPRLPDGTEFKQTSKMPSKFGASQLLLGLNMEENVNILDDSKIRAIAARSRQEFLARIGAIESEQDNKTESFSSPSSQHTLLPWEDGVARLVLILGLENELAIARAADSIASAAINERLRMAFKEAGAVKRLACLLDCNNVAVRLAVSNALEKLTVSNSVCHAVEAEGVIYNLVETLKDPGTQKDLKEKCLTILARILDPSKEMRSEFFVAHADESDALTSARNSKNASLETSGNTADAYQSKANNWRDVLDSELIASLVDVLMTSPPALQRKAASILEFMTITEPLLDAIIAANVGSGLLSVFNQKILDEASSELYAFEPVLRAADLEEAGLAISSASRLLMKLLDVESFQRTIDTNQFKTSLRKILKSDIPLQYKEWVAASIVKLSPFPRLLESPIDIEVTLYETTPRLIEQIKESLDSSSSAQEAAVVELNRIVSEGVVDSTLAVADKGGIPPLVKLIEQARSERAVEAGLAILYNIAMNVENHPAILTAGAVPVLRKIVLLQRPQWKRALLLLRSLPV